MSLRAALRLHNPPSIPCEPHEEESRLIRVIYAPCRQCNSERPYLVHEDDPLLENHEFVDLVVALDEILFHCHFPTRQ